LDSYFSMRALLTHGTILQHNEDMLYIARATIHSSLRRILKIFQDNSPVQDCERKRLVYLADQQTPFLHELSNYFA